MSLELDAKPQRHPGHRFADESIMGSIGFLITGDEEGPAINGTEKLLRWAYEKGERFDHCIVGEPTSWHVLGDALKIGRRGSLSGTLIVAGRQGHAAYPERAENPIPKLIRLLDALTAAPLDKGTPRFEPSNLEIVSVDVGNPAFNVIPAEARARVNVRFNDLWTPETLAAELRRRLDSVGMKFTLTMRDFCGIKNDVHRQMRPKATAHVERERNS